MLVLRKTRKAIFSYTILFLVRFLVKLKANIYRYRNVQNKFNFFCQN